MFFIQTQGLLCSWCIVLSNVLTLHKILQWITWVIYTHNKVLIDNLRVDLAAAWEALLAFDSLIFILTVLKTYKGRHRHRFISMRRINIVSLVLRDGVSANEPLHCCETDLKYFHCLGATYYGWVHCGSFAKNSHRWHLLKCHGLSEPRKHSDILCMWDTSAEFLCPLKSINSLLEYVIMYMNNLPDPHCLYSPCWRAA